MEKLTQEIPSFEHHLAPTNLEIDRFESQVETLKQRLQTQLEFQLLFRSGDDRLREPDRQRVSMLAKYMQRTPNAHLRLEGHADARGSDEYNNILAKYRAQAVADALIVRGIAQDRIRVESRGASQALSRPDGHEGYSQDRCVFVEVYSLADSLPLQAEQTSDLALMQ